MACLLGCYAAKLSQIESEYCWSAGFVLVTHCSDVNLQVTLCNKDPREVERLMRPLGQGAAVNYHAATAQYL